MTTTVIRERCLNNDEVHLADNGKVFKGNYVAILEYYTYANEWSDHKHIKRFRSMQALEKYIDKHYQGVLCIR